jgi:hypothetical protein
LTLESRLSDREIDMAPLFFESSEALWRTLAIGVLAYAGKGFRRIVTGEPSLLLYEGTFLRDGRTEARDG